MFFLTSIMDRPVEGKAGEAIGRIEDVIVRMGDDRYPPISGLVVRDGRRRFFVSANLLQELNGTARLSSSTVDLQPFSRRSGEVLLRRLGPRAFAGRVVGRHVVDWTDVQYLASTAPVQLKVSYDRLAELHPV